MSDLIKNSISIADDIESKIENGSEEKISLAFKALLGAAVAAIILLVVVISLYFWKFHGRFSAKNGDWGTFGDFVGGTLNPIFSLLAFFALLYTIKLQSKELRNSTDQLRKSASALEIQNRHWEHQNFQSSFFTVFTIYNNSVSDLFYTYNNTQFKGRLAMDKVSRELAYGLNNSRKFNVSYSFEGHLNDIFDDEELKSFCRDYVSVLIRALAFFDAYQIDNVGRNQLVDYFVKGLGADESIISFYYSIYNYKSIENLKGVKFLPKKYNIYRNLVFSDQLTEEKQWLFYFRS